MRIFKDKELELLLTKGLKPGSLLVATTQFKRMRVNTLKTFTWGKVTKSKANALKKLVFHTASWKRRLFNNHLSNSAIIAVFAVRNLCMSHSAPLRRVKRRLKKTQIYSQVMGFREFRARSTFRRVSTDWLSNWRISKTEWLKNWKKCSRTLQSWSREPTREGLGWEIKLF